jgi:AcrR family transcriptional regulator
MTTTGEPARRVTRRRIETRARLLSGAREVFAEEGVHGASVEDICDRAGFTRGAFYSNFADKDELVLALFADDRAALLERLRAVLADPPGDVVALMSAVMDQLEVGDPHRWFVTRTEMTLHALRTPSVGSSLVEDRAAFRGIVAEAVAEALARTGRTLDMPVELLVRTVEALHDGATAQSLLEPDALPDGTLQRQVLPRLMEATAPVVPGTARP